MLVLSSSVSSAPFHPTRRGLFGNAGRDTNTNMAISRPRKSLRSAWLKSIQEVRIVLASPFILSRVELNPLIADPPIKRFAQRHTCQNTDAIAARDLGVAIVRQSSTLGRSDTLQTIIPSNSQNSNESTGDRNVRPTSSQATVTGSSGHKRAASPDYKRGRDSDVGPSHGKRARSPSARDRGYRWGEAGSRRRYASPSWDRDRVRDAGPPGSGRRGGMKEPAEEEKHVNLPQVLSWFIGTLPPANKFDGKYRGHRFGRVS